jgi:4'-phosphopantetheinyl transferase EntD
MSLVMLHVSQFEVIKARQNEAALLPHNVAPRRREEFLLGRCAARLALRKAGLRYDLPVLRGSRREPCWPDGFVGSITHCEE